jgi:hypothetical protein
MNIFFEDLPYTICVQNKNLPNQIAIKRQFVNLLKTAATKLLEITGMRGITGYIYTGISRLANMSLVWPMLIVATQSVM